jgi:hypothetical protein
VTAILASGVRRSHVTCLPSTSERRFTVGDVIFADGFE